MLKRAFQYKEAIIRQTTKALDDPFYNNLWDSYTSFDMGIVDSNYYHQQFVSLDNSHNIIGFFDAFIARPSGYVESLLVINFDKNKNIIFSKDLKEFVLRLFFMYNYRKIVFSAVVDSRNEKIYDRFISKYGGRVVGVFKSHKTLQNGQLVDMKYYEILREELKNKFVLTHPSIALKTINKGII